MTSMKLEINDIQKADIFIQMFQNIKLFTNSVCLSFYEERLYVQGMDNNHVSIFEINLMKEWFDLYQLSSPLTIGVNTIIFHKILNTRGQDHKILLSIEKNNQDKLSIDFICDSKGEFNKAFHMPLMELDTEHMGIPDTEYDLEFTLSSKKIKSIIDELSNFGDTINITYENDIVQFSSQTESEGSMKIKADVEDFELCSVVEGAIVDSGYATRFIQFMTHFHKINKSCTIFIQSDIPTQLKYSLEDKTDEENEERNIEQENYVRFFLAPKIKDTEEQ